MDEFKNTPSTTVSSEQSASEAACDELVTDSSASVEFYTNMSDELRPSLTSIVGVAKLLLQTELDSQQRAMVTNITTAAESLLTVVNEMLTSTKLDENKVTLDERPFSIPNLLRTVSGIFRQQCVERRIQFEIQVDQRAPEWVQGDADRLKQVLINLLINSFKFSSNDSTIELVVRLEVKGNDRMQFTFSVSDSGSAISPADLQKIYRPFSRERPHLERVSGGVELGLAISANLVELMGGMLEVESEQDKGSRFFFTIPLQALEEQAPFAEQVPQTKHIVRSLNILLVEDNNINEIIALRLLERDGHQVTVARDGQEAVDLCNKESYELILMDMELPILSGSEATLKIRKLPLNKQVPIVALSAHALKTEREYFLSQGLDAYLTKPLIADELYAVIERLSTTSPENY